MFFLIIVCSFTDTQPGIFDFEDNDTSSEFLQSTLSQCSIAASNSKFAQLGGILTTEVRMATIEKLIKAFEALKMFQPATSSVEEVVAK